MVEPWQMTEAEWAKSPQGMQAELTPLQWRLYKDDAKWIHLAHENLIHDALVEGKPVPAEVLKDYPDLTKKHSNPEAAPAKGTCYEDAWRFQIKQEEGILVHGSVTGADGVTRKHAWVELPTGFIYEPQTARFFKADVFKRAFNPKEDARYTVEEAAKQVARKGYHGAWAEEVPAVPRLKGLEEYIKTAREYPRAVDEAFMESVLPTEGVEAIREAGYIDLRKFWAEANAPITKPPAVKTEEWKFREAIADTVYGLAHGVKEGDIRKHLTRNPRAKYWFEPEDVEYILKEAKREVPAVPEVEPTAVQIRTVEIVEADRAATADAIRFLTSGKAPTADEISLIEAALMDAGVKEVELRELATTGLPATQQVQLWIQRLTIDLQELNEELSQAMVGKFKEVKIPIPKPPAVEEGDNPTGKVITKEEAIGLLERLSMTPGEAARSLVADEAERREIMQTVQQRVKREQNKWAPMDPREGPPLPRIFAGLRWPWKK